MQRRDGDVPVEEERHARVENAAAAARQILRSIVALLQRPPDLGLARHGPAVVGRRDALLVRSLLVIDDRVRPFEAVAREALLPPKPSVRAAESDVMLGRDLAYLHAVEHLYTLPSERCWRSMLSKRARK